MHVFSDSLNCRTEIIRWIDRCEFVPRLALDELIVNKQTNRLFVLDTVRRGELDVQV